MGPALSVLCVVTWKGQSMWSVRYFLLPSNEISLNDEFVSIRHHRMCEDTCFLRYRMEMHGTCRATQKLRQFPVRERDSLSPMARSVESSSKVVELTMTTHLRRVSVSREWLQLLLASPENEESVKRQIFSKSLTECPLVPPQYCQKDGRYLTLDRNRDKDMIARSHSHYLEACFFPRDTSRYFVIPIALTDVVFAGSSVHRDSKRDQCSYQFVRLKQSRRKKKSNFQDYVTS